MVVDVEAVRSRLRSDEVVGIWRTCLGSWESAEAAQRQAVLDWVQGYLDHARSLVEPLDDPEDLRYALAQEYIELKSRWMTLNTQIQFQCLRRGTPDPATTYRASLISFLIQEIEPLLPERDIEVINDFLSDPFGEEAAP